MSFLCFMLVVVKPSFNLSTFPNVGAHLYAFQRGKRLRRSKRRSNRFKRIFLAREEVSKWWRRSVIMFFWCRRQFICWPYMNQFVCGCSCRFVKRFFSFVLRIEPSFTTFSLIFLFFFYVEDGNINNNLINLNWVNLQTLL